MPEDAEVLQQRTSFYPAAVVRKGDVVYKDAGPWSSSVHVLLRHLEQIGFDGAPRVVNSGFDDTGRQTLTFIPGDCLEIGIWSLDGAHRLGGLVRRLHDATAKFIPSSDAIWHAWFGRDLGDGPPVIGHCDIAPWNVVARNGSPLALIDWEFAGPVDPLVDLAQACWLNAKLHNDLVPEELPPLSERLPQLRAIVEGYGLAREQRRVLVDRMIEVAVHATASEADAAGIRTDSRLEDLDPVVPWAIAWRARDAVYLMNHRNDIEEGIR